MADFTSIFARGLFAGKVAIITGGGSGIGYAIAKQLAYLGCTVVIGSRSKGSDKLQTAANEINAFIQSTAINSSQPASEAQTPPKCIAIKLDIRSSASIKQFIGTLRDEHRIQRVDYLVNNAGGQYMSELQSITEKGWKSVIDLNLNGIFLMSQSIFNVFWKAHANKNGKVIINITANSFQGMPMMAHSSSARAAVENLTMVMAQNWSKYGVRANSVAPGFIYSSGLKTYPQHVQKTLMLHQRNNYLYRIGTVDEVANAVLFLLSGGASFITGACLRVDGGESIYHPLLPPRKPLYKSKDLNKKTGFHAKL